MAYSYNRIILVGRLTADPVIKYTMDNTPVASFTLAVDRGYSSKNGNSEVDFIPIEAWRDRADFAGKYLNKGMLILVEGKLVIRKWTDQSGNKRTFANVRADRIQFMEKKSANRGNNVDNNNFVPPIEDSNLGNNTSNQDHIDPGSDIDIDDIPF
jgi:single-strand DNA-binding protein